MRNIAIIGSGIVGLLAAHGLLKAGYKVTLYSDRSAEQWLNESKPTGTAARFNNALDYERELGLAFWDDMPVKGEGVFLSFCPSVGNQLLDMKARFRKPFMAVDLRLQCSCWMNEFQTRGGNLVIQSVSVEDLDRISAAHDLTIVSAGRAELSKLFARDAGRSVYDQPQRNLAMVITTGAKMGFDAVPFLPVKINIVGAEGEAFWVPYLHKDKGASWNLLFEAKPGGKMDRFGQVKSGAELLELCKQVIKDLIPADYAWAKDMQLADPNGWLVGRFAPTVREPVGRLPSGRIITPLGDTAISFDPIAAQGANTGVKAARNMVEKIVAHGDRPFDETWMTDTFNQFYDQTARHAYDFTNLLLEPMTPAAQEFLIAQYGSDGRTTNLDNHQRLANAFADNFDDPSTLTPALLDMPKMRSFISQTTKRPWQLSAVLGRGKVIGGQIKQRLPI